MPDRKPTAFDLFCGCGGVTEGLTQAGFRVIGAVDNDPLAMETYRSNHGHVKTWTEDICRLTVSRVMKDLGLQKGQLDLLAACPPCQGFSSVRTLNGSLAIDDPRNDLVFQVLRFVRVLRPKTIMFENVPGLAKDQRFSLFRKKLEEDLKYVCTVAILNAAEYGVPQRRRRLILIGSRLDPIEFPPKASKRQTVKETIRSLPPAGQSGDPLHDIPEKRSERIKALIERIPEDGGSRTDLSTEHQLACHRRCNGFKDIYGRMAWENVAPTITSGCVNPSKGRFLHPRENRAITLREAALLQSFPPTYHFSLRRGKYATAALIGNALPPEFIRRLACAIREHLSTTARR